MTRNSGYNLQSQHIAVIYTGSGSYIFKNFIVYLRAGFVYRIVTNGVVGNYFRYQAPTTIPFRPAYRYWNNGGASASGASITYTPVTSLSYAIVKTFSTLVDSLGVTANPVIIYSKNLTDNANINGSTTDSRVQIQASNMRQIHQEYYLCGNNITTSPLVVPMVNTSLYGIGTTVSTSASQICFAPVYDGSQTNSPNFKMAFPFRVRCVGFSFMIDTDLTTASPVLNVRLRLSSALLGGGTQYYDDTYQFIGGAYTNGGAGAKTSFTNDVAITTPTVFYGYCNFTNSGGTAFSLTSEWTCIFYFQQVLL